MEAPGQLGAWTRALLTYQLGLIKSGRQLHHLHRFSVRLRQLAAITEVGLEMGWETLANPEWKPMADLLKWWQAKQPSKPAGAALARGWAQMENAIHDDMAQLFKAGVRDPRTYSV